MVRFILLAAFGLAGCGAFVQVPTLEIKVQTYFEDGGYLVGSQRAQLDSAAVRPTTGVTRFVFTPLCVDAEGDEVDLPDSEYVGDSDALRGMVTFTILAPADDLQKINRCEAVINGFCGDQACWPGAERLSDGSVRYNLRPAKQWPPDPNIMELRLVPSSTLQGLQSEPTWLLYQAP